MAGTTDPNAAAAAKIVEEDVKTLLPAVGTVVNSTPGLITEVKAGYKTTEFWVTVVGVVLAQLGALHLPGKYGTTITTAALALSYILSRGFAKAGAAKG